MKRRIQSGGMLPLDPDADEAFEMDWNRQHLPTGVAIDSSTWFIEGMKGAASLEQHDDAIGRLTGSEPDEVWEANAAGRVTRVFLTGSTGITLGQRYIVTNRIVTDTTPPETKDASFIVLIQHE